VKNAEDTLQHQEEMSPHCQESLDHALNDIKGKFVDTFIDDSLVWSNTVEQHAQHLEQV